MTEEQINKLSPYHRDFLEVWGNQWTPKKVMPGTCLACVYGGAPCDHLRSCSRWAPYGSASAPKAFECQGAGCKFAIGAGGIYERET